MRSYGKLHTKLSRETHLVLLLTVEHSQGFHPRAELEEVADTGFSTRR